MIAKLPSRDLNIGDWGRGPGVAGVDLSSGGAGFAPIFSDHGGLETFGFRCARGGRNWALASDESLPWRVRLQAISDLLEAGDRSGFGVLRALVLDEGAPLALREQAARVAADRVVVHLADVMRGHPDVGPWRMVHEPLAELLREAAEMQDAALRELAREGLERYDEEKAWQEKRRRAGLLPGLSEGR